MASKSKVLSQVGLLGGHIERGETEKATKDYEEYFKQEDDSKRTGNYTDVVNKYYDLARWTAARDRGVHRGVRDWIEQQRVSNLSRGDDEPTDGTTR